MSFFCFWLKRLCFRQAAQIRPGIEHGNSDYDCRWNSFTLVTLHLFFFLFPVVFFRARGPLNAVVGSAKLQKCCLMFPAHIRAKCWGVFQNCPPGHLVMHLTSCFLFVFPSPLFLLLTVARHCSLEEGFLSCPPRLTSEFVLVNCRTSSALLFRWQSHQALIYERSVYNLPA